MRKINLKKFQVSKLKLSEKLNIKGGSGGSTYSRKNSTRCLAHDCDIMRSDRD